MLTDKNLIMKTTINNEHRVFWIKALGYSHRNYFCNMEEIEKCVRDLPDNEDYSVHEFWNNKPVRLGRKRLSEILKANQIDHSFINSK